MRQPATISALAAVTVAIGLTVTGCGSGGDSAESTESSASSSASSVAETTTAEATETTAAAPADTQTVGEYLTAQGVTQTIVKRGDPGVPTLNLPMPDGWADVGADTPEDAYGAIYLESAKGTPNPPAILARMARLEGGEFDDAKILELSPNAVTKTPGWDGPTEGQPSTLGGFDAMAIAGTAVVDGAPNFIARKTVVIPAPEHTYVLALDAQGPVDQQQTLMDAMTVIDEQTTIEP
jgi:Probable lipoprotein LpqN